MHVSYFDRLFNGLDTELIDHTERIINLKTFQFIEKVDGSTSSGKGLDVLYFDLTR